MFKTGMLIMLIAGVLIMFAGTAPAQPLQFELIPYNWVEIRDVGINTGINWFQNLGPFPIGFPFPWYDGVTHDSIRVCCHGYLAFTSTIVSNNNTQLPDPATYLPNDAIYPFWDNFELSLGGHIWYYDDVANQRFIVEWDSARCFPPNATKPYTFEAILYPNGNIDFMYKDVKKLWPSWGYNTVGIEDGEGTRGLQCTSDGCGPIEPDSHMGLRIYHAATEPLPLNLDMTLTSSYEIPPGGGFLDLDINLDNSTMNPVTFDAWAMMRPPLAASFFGPVGGPQVLTVPANSTLIMQRRQYIPASLAPGTYRYELRAGDYPDGFLDWDDFQFVKLAGNGPQSGSTVDGWFWEEPPAPNEAVVDQPSAFGLKSATPNPFNPTTAISYQLSAINQVSLKVYDTAGRLVSTLVDGQQEAGVHEVKFNGSGLASGLYFVRMTAGDFTAVQKLMLVK